MRSLDDLVSFLLDEVALCGEKGKALSKLLTMTCTTSFPTQIACFLLQLLNLFLEMSINLAAVRCQ